MLLVGSSVLRELNQLSLNIRTLNKPCLHMARLDGKMVSFETYDLFYREG